ncbi:hypothetical protein FOMPIDRAFT_1024287 [Fomitopsis schrenkii]|uniref:Uncharacterized protein n=1 Tax=Fomitopsis schrenkii TaxID=2126942 RepID=S8E387_FOMSC|nr:hypothetical protein FOMPIDRAFT_1024287 [Fomitopsis schrenkii]
MADTTSTCKVADNVIAFLVVKCHNVPLEERPSGTLWLQPEVSATAGLLVPTASQPTTLSSSISTLGTPIAGIFNKPTVVRPWRPVKPAVSIS